jgi:hypothetical protein
MGVPGDYLYTTFVPNQNMLGSWGIFRVLDSSGNPLPPNNQACVPTNTQPAPRKSERDPNDFIRQPFGKAVRQP